MSLPTRSAPSSAPAAGAADRPLRAVLAACTAGAGTVQEVADRVGLSRDVVEAAADYLVQTGRLASAPFAGGCPSGGCGACPVANSATGSECATSGSSHPSVRLLTLSRRSRR